MRVEEYEEHIKIMEEENWDSHSMYEWYERNVPDILSRIEKLEEGIKKTHK